MSEVITGETAMDQVVIGTAAAEMAPTSEVVLETHGVNVYYGSNHALHDTSLAFHKGEITALIGPSGCGKSTFLRSLNLMNREIKGCRVEGETAHSGAVDHEFRHDAVAALTDLLYVMNRHWEAWLHDGKDLVFTCGVINTPSTADISIISGDVCFGLDMRSLSMETIRAFHDLLPVSYTHLRAHET